MKNLKDLQDIPHRRYNPLTGQWVLVSPHRAKRPWQGQTEDLPPDTRPPYDPTCYLCPGNSRADGGKNPAYTGTYAFTNDFSALLPEVPEISVNEGGLLQARSEPGICRVLCFSPRHDLTLPGMTVAEVGQVVEMWCREYRELGARPEINSVLIFENKGQMMGCSNPHPHGQIWAQGTLPSDVQREHDLQGAFFAAHGRTLLADYLSLEESRRERLVCRNEHFVALVPFWAVWPFETMLVSRRPRRSLLDMDNEERLALADLLRQLTGIYDRLFGVSFPYSAGMHQAPTDGGDHPHWHWHMHFYPPLLRSATVKKFMVGYELLGEPQRDITPEWSAARLRELL